MNKPKSSQSHNINKTRPETLIKLNMTFEQAVKKAVNTPIPKNYGKKKK